MYDSQTQPLVVALFVAIYAIEWYRGRDEQDDRDDLADARAAYVAGDIDLAEFETRAELALDPEAERIRETVTEVNGVGPATAAAVAQQFETIEELREADRSELEHVNGVGPDRAEAINQRI